ncbi:MAG: hypothetical protein PVJ60_00840 [Phycisphaerales bacterium]|jgi:antitoxin component of MazEF toxin-antitoxin module
MATVKFNSGTMRIGNTTYLRLPPTVVDNLNLNESNSAIIVISGANKITAEFQKEEAQDEA